MDIRQYKNDVKWKKWYQSTKNVPYNLLFNQLQSISSDEIQSLTLKLISKDIA